VKCYLAGPMRGYVDYNKPAFYDGEARLLAAGWAQVLNPARMDDVLDGPLGLVEDGTPNAWRRYARRDLLAIIDQLRGEEGDALVLLPGWEASTGANAEYRVAKWVGLQILTLEEAIKWAADAAKEGA